MSCYQRLTNVSFKAHATNKEDRRKIQSEAIAEDKNTPDRSQKFKLRLLGHIWRFSILAELSYRAK